MQLLSKLAAGDCSSSTSMVSIDSPVPTWGGGWPNALAIAAGAGLWVLWRCLLDEWRRQAGHPPILPLYRLPVEVVSHFKDTSKWVQTRLGECGGTFSVTSLFGEMTVLEPTEANIRSFEKLSNIGWPDHFKTVVGRTALAMNNGPIHRRLRAVCSRAFTQANLDSYLGTFQQVSQKHVAQWSTWGKDSPRDARDAVKFYTFELANRLILGMGDEPEEKTRHTMHLFQTVIEGLGCLIHLDLPGFHWRRVLASRRDLCAIYQEAIDVKRANPPAQAGCLLDNIMLGANQDATMPTDEELQDACVLMGFAGHDTTLCTALTMLHFLDLYPDVQKDLREEVDSVWDGRAPVTRDLLQRLHKVKAFTVEVLRLMPPVGMAMRTAAAEVELPGGGFKVGAGKKLGLGLRSVGDRRFPEDADELKLSRWLDAQGHFVDKIHDFTSVASFGGGARMCLGYKFALDEMHIFLLTLLRNVEFAVSKRRHRTFPWNYYAVECAFWPR